MMMIKIKIIIYYYIYIYIYIMIVLSSVMWYSIYGLVIKNDVKFWVALAIMIINVTIIVIMVFDNT